MAETVSSKAYLAVSQRPATLDSADTDQTLRVTSDTHWQVVCDAGPCD